MDRVVTFRKQYALDVGFVVPRLRVKDNKKLPPNSYEINIYGVKVGEGEILEDRILAINPGNVKQKLEGVDTKDPTYGLPAVWIAENNRDMAKKAGYTIVEPITVLMTHLSEVFKQQSPNLLSRNETERLIDRVKERDEGLVDELVPNVLALTDIQKILQNLLKERVSIRNMESILEVLVDQGKQIKDPEILTEFVRNKLSATICQSLSNSDGEVYVLTLDPSVEQTLASSVKSTETQSSIVIEPRYAESLLKGMAAQVEKMMSANHMPVLLCAPELRRHLRRFTERVVPHLSILSLSEVPNSVNLKSFGMVSV